MRPDIVGNWTDPSAMEELGKFISQSLVFSVNGQRFELQTVEPSTTLLEFLRTQTRYTGAKFGCGEGGCGACVVLLATYDPLNEQVKEFAISSCLTLLCSINFCAITTTEGLGDSRDGFHPIHERFSGFHASQCGFCTPGMCMSLFSALVNAEKKTERPLPPDGFSRLSVSEAEKAITGNLCRCTGYRPIVDACKSFAADVDLEDLGLNSFWRKGKHSSHIKKLPSYRSNFICTFPEFLKLEIKSFFNFISASQPDQPTKLNVECQKNCTIVSPATLVAGCWYRPSTVDILFKLLNSKEVHENMIKMVVGNTGSGVYKEVDLYDKFIDLRGIPELSTVKLVDSGIQLGAAVTISTAIDVLSKERNSLVFNKIAEHMNKVASQFVRNSASLGGNLVLSQKKQLPSDIATILLAVDSTVSILTNSGRLLVSLENFLGMPPLDFQNIMLNIHVPSWKSVTYLPSINNGFADFGVNVRRGSKFLFKTYRAALRPQGNAVAYLNSAFLAQVSVDETSEFHVIDNLRLAFGAYGQTIRARDVEKFLLGKSVTSSVLLGAVRMITGVIVPKKDTAHHAYRSSLAAAFLFHFLRPICKGLKDIKGNDPLLLGNDFVTVEHVDGDFDECFNNQDPLLSSSQLLVCNMIYCPIGEPVKKVGAELQSSGEAIFVDDIPSPKDCLFGAFICSTRPLARIKGMHFKSAKALQKVISVISVSDIPKGGQNVGTGSIFGTDPLFADSVTLHTGQPIGVVIAETQRFANLGAKQVVVDYSTEDLEPPILSVEEAVRRSSFFEVPTFLYPNQVGDLSQGMAKADHKIISAEINLPSQYYFYMETQTALAVPDEGNCMVVYSSTQCPENASEIISKCLGIPTNNVRVITRRVGGGFGGKAIRSVPIATACALAAFKLRRPVRMCLDRRTDMLIAGGRHPMKVKYSVGFNSDGKITALHVDLLINAGFSPDVSPVMPHNIAGALKKYNWGTLSFDFKVCKTNLPSKSAMRAPGEVQGSFIAEAVIEHVASSLSIDASLIRKKNLHSFESLKLFFQGCEGETSEYTLPSLVDKLFAASDYSTRVEMVQRFNSFIRWKKRGISWIPIVHPVMVRSTPAKVGILQDGSVVVEVGGIELGQGLWTKVKQMAAYSLGQLWSDGGTEILERIRVIQADTLSLIQGGWTTGSTTSESSCEAVRLACNVLIDRLKPLKEMLQEQTGSVSWNDLILQARLQSVNLSASTYWVPDQGSMQYLNYGAAVSEVEVDVLTGRTTILRTDLIYDCGQSLNPAVDLGQIEGAFVQGIGFFMYEEYLSNADGLVISDGTWTYKIPTVDTIPRKFNIEIVNSGHHKQRVLSSKASGEPPLLLAASVHCATREAIRAARADRRSFVGVEECPHFFQLDVPATLPVVKQLCGLDNVELFLEAMISPQNSIL
ncbi:hypothetical protein HPP92_015649 [Vanilla planifolia]|uniref:Uncharacterized protein n=1 Tax=Vanilla planifolia TaxID=51239 RepID=A0A835QS05_VANPL|nr:hypothetical protein HPP92_015649 [Vanilla planifolia]